MPTPTNAQIASQITSLLTQWNAREAEFRDWLAGAATGGPNGDGRFPLTNASGVSALVDSPAKLADTIGGPAGLSLQSRLLAEAARDITLGYRDSAAQDALKAVTAKTEATDARDLAKLYRDDAAAHAANLQVTRDATNSFRESAQLARDEAVAAKDTSVQAKADTLVARAEAVTARDQAEAFAASINPATLASKSDLATEIAKLVDSAPATLNTLKEFATALGNDPNFATTITTQLAGKAPLVHSHGIADVTGLQTALDGKQPVGSYAAVGHTHSTLSDTLLIGEADLNADRASGIYRVTRSGYTQTMLNLKGLGSTYQAQLLASYGNNLSFRTATDSAANWSPWVTVWHSGNFDPSTKQAAGSYAAAIHSHNTFDIVDSRSAYRTPNDSAGASLTAEFTNQLPGAGDWHSLLNVKGWTSGYTSWQLIGPSSTTAHENLYFRSGVGTTWGALRKVWHSGNFDPATKQAAGNYLQLGAGSRVLDFDYGGGAMSIRGDSGGWSTGYFFKGGSGTFRGGFGAHGSADALSKFWIGANYDSSAVFNVYPSGDVDLNGNLGFRAVRNQIVSQYDPTTTQGIWAMGGSYVLPAGNSNNYGSLYGLAWSYEPGYGGAGNNPQSKVGLSHQLLLMHAGQTKTAIGTGIWTVGSIFANGNSGQPVRADRLYRSDDQSAYFIQHSWTGTHWWLRGYTDSGFHAEVRVGYADVAGNTNALQGYTPAEAATGSTIPVRSGAGYLYAAYFNQSSSSGENPAFGSIFVEHANGDGFLRKATAAHVAQTLAQQPGHRRTISTAAPSGGSSGDIWFKV
jgi:hypothetical protein